MDKSTITTTYLERYLQVKSQLNDHSPEILNAEREQAFQYLSDHPLPKTYSEEYKRFDIDDCLSEAWDLNLTRKSYGVDPLKEFPCRLAYMSAVQSFILDDRIYKVDAQPSSVAPYFIGNIRDFAQQYPEAAKLYNSAPSLLADPLSQFNTLYAQDALVIYVPRNVQLTEPLHLIQLAGIAPQTLTFPRLLIVAEEGSRVSLLACDHAASEHRSMRNSVVEIHVGARASVAYYDVEETASVTTRLHNVHVVQAADSNCVVSNLTINNGRTRNNYYADLMGQGASLDLSGLAILDGEQKADNFSIIRHSAPHCESNELFKYALNDRSVGSFCGRIYVARDAQKTASYQTNRNLLLSDTAKMYSKPQLEIYADDVKCSHGMTTGQIDENALFYMVQRGIPKMEARLLLTIAFMADVLESIRLEPLRQRLAEVIEKRFRGIPATCSDHCSCH